MSELWELGAFELGTAIRDGSASSREVVEAHLARIEAVNPDVNAVTDVLADDALSAADDADAVIARGEPTSPFHGVPFTVKESIDLAGSPTTQGVAALAEMIPAFDAPAVANLRGVGAIPFARSSAPDLALRWHTDNALHGPTRNPWDAARTPGGSSGGEAAALATGMTPLGVGSDLGGSLRWPSACCGTAAVRPTLGRIPVATSLEPADAPLTMQLMAVQGPMARAVLDLRIAFEIMSRASDRDPWYTPVPFSGPAVPNPIRVAIATDPSGDGVDPAIAGGVRRVASALVDAGYAVEEVPLPVVNEASEVWLTLILAEIRMMWSLFEAIISDDARRFLGAALELREPLAQEAYGAAFMQRQGIARTWTQFLSDVPLVVGPVATQLPFPVGADLGGAEDVDRLRRMLDLTLLCNCIGLPSVALPAGIAHDLPVGVQIIGPRFREDLCLAAAWEVERALGPITPIDPRG
ncbi:MAG TPA: amidase [Acidimicrobiia bacterium]|nr:amidase [Acidimicrobiia bacterium]